MQPLSQFVSRNLRRAMDASSGSASGDEAEQRAAQKRFLDSREELWRKICPPLYFETNLSRLAPPSGDVIAFRFPTDGLGVLLTGPTGTGKTRTAWMLAGRRFCIRTLSFLNFTGPALAYAIVQAYQDGSIEGLKNKLCAVDILMLDDMFKANWTPAQETIVFELLEQRSAWKKNTIITMNCDGKALRKILSDDMRDPFMRRLSPPFFKPFVFRQKPKDD